MHSSRAKSDAADGRAHRDALARHLLDVLIYGATRLEKLDFYSKSWVGEDDQEDEEPFLRKRDKLAAEAMLLGYLATRAAFVNERLTEATDSIIESARREILTPRNEALLRRFPQSASSLGLGHVLLTTLGRAPRHYRDMLARAAKQRFVSLSERTVFRLMDLRWTYGLMDAELIPHVDELLPHSVLYSKPHPIYTMKNDEYAITHSLYYLTDFGLRPPPEQVAECLSGGMLDHYLAWSAVREDLDLLGEFLMAAVVAGATRSPSFDFAWEVFFRAWDGPGGLVGPDYSPDRRAELEGDEADAYSFSENYHTIFVGGMLCAIALTELPSVPAVDTAEGRDQQEILERCGAAITRFEKGPYGLPAKVVDSLGDGSLEWAVARILSVTGHKVDPAPPWLGAAMDSALSRQRLREILYDALLIAASREYYLTYLAEALAVGATEGLSRRETFWRALDFLLGQQLTDGFIGVHKLLGETHQSSAIPDTQTWIAGCLRQVMIGTAAR